MNRVTVLFVVIAITITALLSSACRSQSGETPPPEEAISTPIQTSVPSPTPTAEPAPDTPAPTPTPLPPDIINTLETTPELSSLLRALQSVDLVEKLQSDGPFTLFAPSNAAFDALPEALLQEDDGALFDLLLYHIVAGQATPQQLVVADSIVPLLGDEAPLRLSSASGEEGGILIEDVPLPQNATTVNNGLIYIIDTVLLPPDAQVWIRSRTVQSAVPQGNAQLPGLLDLAQEYDQLSTLRDGWEAADLIELLSGDGPFTIFAPTDAAFANLADTASDELLYQLDTAPAPYLLYLVVPAYISSAALQDGLEMETSQGQLISVAGAANTGTANAEQVELVSTSGITATVSTADLPAGNGILHIIDTVLLPEVTAPDSP